MWWPTWGISCSTSHGLACSAPGFCRVDRLECPPCPTRIPTIPGTTRGNFCWIRMARRSWIGTAAPSAAAPPSGRRNPSGWRGCSARKGPASTCLVKAATSPGGHRCRRGKQRSDQYSDQYSDQRKGRRADPPRGLCHVRHRGLCHVRHRNRYRRPGAAGTR